nr:DUF1501 domain-containing protein [Verrucomicrobiota bacterium]
MQALQDFATFQTRRAFLHNLGLSAGGIALTHLLGRDAAAALPPPAGTGSRVHPPLPGMPHFAPTAKRLIYLHMNGAPSQLDLFDYKPGLVEQFDKELPASIRGNQRITTMTSGQSRLPVAPSIFKFAQHGQCGMWVSELLKHTATVVDDLALIKT